MAGNPETAFPPQPDRPAPPQSAADALDCWSRIGVDGDRTCRELESVVHCRNCAVYSEAAPHVLDRPLPPGYRAEWTEHFAQKRKSSTGSKISCMIFRLGPEWLALTSRVFQEVAEHRVIHSIPHRRHGVVLGLANVRGELLLCVSLGWLLGLETADLPENLCTVYERLLLANWDGRQLAFPVNEVHGIHRFDPEELIEPPQMIRKAALTFTQGVFAWQGRWVGLLEPEFLFATLHRHLP